MPLPTAGKTYTVTGTDPTINIRMYHMAIRGMLASIAASGQKISLQRAIQSLIERKFCCTFKYSAANRMRKHSPVMDGKGYIQVAIRVPMEVKALLEYKASLAQPKTTMSKIVINWLIKEFRLSEADFSRPRHLRVKRGRPFECCPHCGYDLRGSDDDSSVDETPDGSYEPMPPAVAEDALLDALLDGTIT